MISKLENNLIHFKASSMFAGELSLIFYIATAVCIFANDLFLNSEKICKVLSISSNCAGVMFLATCIIGWAIDFYRIRFIKE